MNYCVVDKRTPTLPGEVLGADTTGPAVTRVGTHVLLSGPTRKGFCARKGTWAWINYFLIAGGFPDCFLLLVCVTNRMLRSNTVCCKNAKPSRFIEGTCIHGSSSIFAHINQRGNTSAVRL